jgi:hypothetical protein
MKTKYFALLLTILALSGCKSSSDFYHTSERYEIVLSRQHRGNAKDDVTLVGINRDGRVCIRDTYDTLWRARKGEHFTNSSGGGSGYMLKSVNRATGWVVIEGEMRIYHFGGSSSPAMVAR